ncbi:hypothetical protein Droror1_Dr00007432 [Drosera rotundifolia]
MTIRGGGGGGTRSQETSLSWALVSNSENSSGDHSEDTKPMTDKKRKLDADQSSEPDSGVKNDKAEKVCIETKGAGDSGTQGKSKKCDNKPGDLKINGKGKREGKDVDHEHEMHIWTERERRKKMRTMFTNLHALLQLPAKADKSTIVDEAVKYIKILQLTLQKLQKQKLEKLQYTTCNATTNLNYDEPSLALFSSSRLGMAGASSSVALDTTREAFMADHVSASPTTCTGLALNLNRNNSSSSSSPVMATGNISFNNMPQFPVSFQTWTSSNVVLNVCGDEAQITVCSPRKTGVFTAICFVLDKYRIEVVSAHISSDANQSIFMIQAHASRAPDLFPGMIPMEDIYKQAAGEIMLWVTS